MNKKNSRKDYFKNWLELRKDYPNSSLQLKTFLGWDEKRKNGYSEVILKADDSKETEKQIREGFEIINSIFHNKKEINKTFTVNAGGSLSYTNKLEANISIMPFLLFNGSYQQKLDIFIGLGVHEFLHNIYTFKTKKYQSVAYFTGIKKKILNILEDERIEMLGAIDEEYRGLTKYLKATKEFMFSYLSKIGKENGQLKREMTDNEKLLNEFLLYVRYPRENDKDFINANKSFFGKVKKILTPYPFTEDEIIYATKEISILFSEYKDEKKKDKNKGDEKNKDNGDGENKDDGDKGKRNGKEDKKKNKNGGDGDKDKNDTDDDDENKSDSSSGDYKVDKDDLNTDPLSKMGSVALDPLIDEIINGSGKIHLLIKTGINIDKVYKEISSDNIERRLNSNSNSDNYKTYFINGGVNKNNSKNKNSYLRTKVKVSSSSKKISKMLNTAYRNSITDVRGVSHGKLDTQKLVEVVQGVKSVYKTKINIKTKTVSVIIVIDESGSMSYNSRYLKAMEFAVLMSEAIDNIKGVDCYIYGHTADYNYSNTSSGMNTIINVYKEQGKEYKYNIGGISAISNNRDGYAYIEIAKRVKKLSNSDNKLMIIISDGNPAASGYSGEQANKHTRMAIKIIKKDFNVIGVGIDKSISPSVLRMFYDEDYISYDNHSNFAKELSSILKKRILKMF